MMHFKYFDQFSINEAKSTKPNVKVVLLSNFNEESYSAQDMEAVFKGRVKKYIPIDVSKMYLIDKNNGTFMIGDDETKSIIDPEDTVILTRRGVVKSTFTRDIVNQLEDNYFFVMNNLESVMDCENKYLTAKILKEYDIPTPRTALVENESHIEPGLKQIGGKFPIVMKTLSGSQGIGVSIIDSMGSLKSVLQTIWKLNSKTEVIFQEKIESDHDLRIHVLTKRFNPPKPEDDDSVLLGYMRRNRVNKKDFRTNHSLGGTVEKTKLTDDQKMIAMKAARALGCNWCGVDIIVDKKTGKNYVLEVNASPGTHGLKKATGVDVLKDVADFILDKSNWIRGRRTIGFRETVYIDGIGDIVGKFDTGNGAFASALTYEKMKISDDKKTVKWELGGKKFEHKIVDWSNAEVGDHIHERPVILMDITFRGRIYKKVHIALHDRTNKSTKFLANRDFMSRLGVSVNPSKAFIVSDAPEGYGAYEAKSDPHGGIDFE
jgi:RimK family alpha-L-glutamate ligase